MPFRRHAVSLPAAPRARPVPASRAMRAAALALALAATRTPALAGEAIAPEPASPAAPVALHQPRPGLFTAGQPGPDAWATLARERGLAEVVNLRPDAEQPGRDEAAEVRAAGLAYVQIPVAGAADVTAANADALWARLQQARRPVLVHCASGNRVGALLALGAARQGGMTPAQALAFGRRAGLGSLEPRVRELLGVAADGAAAGSQP